jgi:hypothetical protein
MQKSRNQDRTSAPVRPQSSDSQSQPESTVPRKTEGEASDTVTSVRLTRKFAQMIDGVDLTEANVGDELNLSPRDADVLIAEGWAERTRHPRRRADDFQSKASDEPSPRRRSTS